MNEYVDIDLSPLLPKLGNIVRGTNLELAVIRFYSMVVTKDNNNLKLAHDYIANYLNFTKGKEYKYVEVHDMLRAGVYDNQLFKFHGMLEYLILREVDPSVTNVVYEKLINRDTLQVRFKLSYD